MSAVKLFCQYSIYGRRAGSAKLESSYIAVGELSCQISHLFDCNIILCEYIATIYVAKASTRTRYIYISYKFVHERMTYDIKQPSFCKLN